MVKKYSRSIGSKGQVTLPPAIRIRLGLETGDRVDFVIEGKRTVLRPARGPISPFEKYKGILGQFAGGVDEINMWVRELRDESLEEK